MKTLTFTMQLQKLDGFDEKDFISILKSNVSEVLAKIVRYDNVEDRYHFEVQFEPISQNISYQPILGCFTSIEREYNRVKLIGIHLEN